MRSFAAVAILFVLSGAAGADSCFERLGQGDTMEEVLEVCGEPTHRRDLGSDMRIREQRGGDARMLSIEHSRTETLWVYENDRALYLRFENGRLAEKELTEGP